MLSLSTWWRLSCFSYMLSLFTQWRLSCLSHMLSLSTQWRLSCFSYMLSLSTWETVLCLWGLRDLQAQGSMVSHASTPPPSIQLTVSLEEPDIPHFTSCNVHNCLLIAPCLWDGILAALLQTFSSHIIHLHISAGWLPEMPLHPLTPFMDSRPDTADFSAIFLKTCLYNLGFHDSATRTLCFY